MGRFILGIQALFAAWFSGEAASRVRQALAPPPPSAPAEPARPVEPPKPAPPPKPKRSEALTLLATLQREARFVDFLKEPIDAYQDAQIGAAVRSIHKDCADVVERLFAVRPVIEAAEGDEVTPPAGSDGGRFRLTGNVTDRPSGPGRLVHHGWEATQCELPQWTGADSVARVIAPAEVELS